MNEIKKPIPSRIYNSAQGGHVCGPEDIDFGQKVVHLIKYDHQGNEVTFEEQVDVNEGGVANTIYVIHDDFTLAADVTIPDNCTLQFDGGSLSGSYTLTGTDTKLPWYGDVIFGSEITLSGTWLCPIISTKMFSDLSADNALRKLQALNTDDIQTSMYIEKESYDYYFSLPTNYDIGIHIHSNTDVYINGTIKCKDSAAAYYMIQVSNKKNVTICGSGTIVGDWDVHSGTGGEFGHCIYLGRNENIKIIGLDISKAWGDGITVSGGTGTPNYGVSVKNCHIHHCRRTGIALSNVVGMDISNCHLHDINGTGTGNCINLEIEGSDGHDYTIKDIKISNCRLENGGLIGFGSREYSTVTNVIVENCLLDNNAEALTGHKYAVSALGNKNILFVNNAITLNYEKLIVDKTATFKKNNIISNVSGWEYIGVFEDNDITLPDGVRILAGTFKNNRINAFGSGPIRGGEFYDNEIVFTATGAKNYALVATGSEIKMIGNRIHLENDEGAYFYGFIQTSTYGVILEHNYFIGTGDVKISDPVIPSIVKSRNDGNHLLYMQQNWVGDSPRRLYLNEGYNMPSGVTDARPGFNIEDGVCFFDTTLMKPFYQRQGWFDASGTRLTWPFTFDLPGMKLSNKNQPVAGQPFTTVLEADSGYTLPSSLIVKINGAPITLDTDYTYDSTTGSVTVNVGGSSGVTGALSIEMPQ